MLSIVKNGTFSRRQNAIHEQHILLPCSPSLYQWHPSSQSISPTSLLSNLRENKHVRVLKQFAQTKPLCLPQISQIYADKPQNNKTSKPHQLQPVFLCEIIQLAVFLCVICAICGRITHKSTPSITN